MTGVAEYEQQGNMLVPKPPTPDMCAGGGGAGAGGGGGFPVVPVAVGALAVAGLVAYFALR